MSQHSGFDEDPKAVKRATTFEWLSFNDPQLREASRCYLYGFMRAAVLIAVAALEVRIRSVVVADTRTTYDDLADLAFGSAGVCGLDPAGDEPRTDTGRDRFTAQEKGLTLETELQSRCCKMRGVARCAMVPVPAGRSAQKHPAAPLSTPEHLMSGLALAATRPRGRHEARSVRKGATDAQMCGDPRPRPRPCPPSPGRSGPRPRHRRLLHQRLGTVLRVRR